MLAQRRQASYFLRALETALSYSFDFVCVFKLKKVSTTKLLGKHAKVIKVGNESSTDRLEETK